MGWEDLQNGKLLAIAGPEFGLFLTVDKNLKHEQNLAVLPIAVFVLIAKSNRTEDLLPLVPTVELLIPNIKIGQLVEIDAGGTRMIAPGRDQI